MKIRRSQMNTFVGSFGLEVFVEWGKTRVAEKLDQITDKEKELVKSYLKETKGESYEVYSKLIGQILFIAPPIRLSEEHTKAGGRSYTYFFTPESTVPYMKSGHAVEVATVFNQKEDTELSGRAFDETFGKIMRKMWVQFAKTGNPSLSEESYLRVDKVRGFLTFVRNDTVGSFGMTY